MKTQIVCAKCGKPLGTAEPGNVGNFYFADDGRIFCQSCGQAFAAQRALETEEASRRLASAVVLPERSLFDSRIAYMVAYAKAKGASDLHLDEGCSPYIRVAGELEPLEGEAPLRAEELRAFLEENTEINPTRFLESNTAADFSVTMSGIRLRGNLYKDNGGINIALRLLTLVSKDFSELGIPQILKRLAERRSGLILITGPTGSGKTTTLTSLVDYINHVKREHIITLEDPIEFVHRNQNCIISQREIGRDARSFSDAITEAMREDPDIILVGEMRDHASIEAALRAAETGHLVLSTLHTKGAVNSITRIVDVFPAAQQNQIRTQLGMSLLGVISQQLLPGVVKGTRHLATEVLIANEPVRAMIRQNKLHLVASAIQTSLGEGMYTMRTSMERLFREHKITKDTFEAYQI